MIKFFYLFLILQLGSCSKSNLEKINTFLEKENYQKLLEFSNKNKTTLTEEEIYLSSVGVSKFQNFLRKNISDDKYSNPNSLNYLEKKIGLPIKIFTADNDKLIVIEDKYLNLLNQSKYYKNKAILDKFRYTVETNDVNENRFLLTDVIMIDPRLYLQEFKSIWIQSMKLGLPAGLNDESRNKFIQILHFLGTKEESEFKNYFFSTEGTNVNLRSGPGIENATVAKLNQEEVFQIDTDYNTTSIGNKSGKWIQIYVLHSDITGWIFSPFLKKSNLNTESASEFEQSLLYSTSSRMIDFNNWNPDSIPSNFYGNYIETKKEILDANVGFTIYASEVEQGICTKLQKDLNKIEISFADIDSSNRILMFSLRAFANAKIKKLTKIELFNHKLYLNKKELKSEIENNKIQSFELVFDYTTESNISLTLKTNSSNIEIFQNIQFEKNDIESWELCLPQGNKSYSHALLFSINIY